MNKGFITISYCIFVFFNFYIDNQYSHLNESVEKIQNYWGKLNN